MSQENDAADRAFAALYEIFSKPIKNGRTSGRRYDLTFVQGEPVFTLSDDHQAVDDWASRTLNASLVSV
jgi:hypothetical protein